MSGGKFDYIQNRLHYTVDDLKKIVYLNDMTREEFEKSEYRECFSDDDYDDFSLKLDIDMILHIKRLISKLEDDAIDITALDYALSGDITDSLRSIIDKKEDLKKEMLESQSDTPFYRK